MKPGFSITRGKGFHISFENGWTVSVQFGHGNYSDNYDANFDNISSVEAGARGSQCAEVWCFNSGTKDNWPDDPLGYQTPAQVAQIIAFAAVGEFPAGQGEDE